MLNYSILLIENVCVYTYKFVYVYMVKFWHQTTNPTEGTAKLLEGN